MTTYKFLGLYIALLRFPFHKEEGGFIAVGSTRMKAISKCLTLAGLQEEEGVENAVKGECVGDGFDCPLKVQSKEEEIGIFDSPYTLR